MTPVPVAPSPKFQAYEASVPSGSLEAVASKATSCSVTVEPKAAVGATLGAAENVRVAAFVRPCGSVTVRVMV